MMKHPDLLSVDKRIEIWAQFLVAIEVKIENSRFQLRECERMKF